MVVVEVSAERTVKIVDVSKPFFHKLITVSYRITLEMDGEAFSGTLGSQSKGALHTAEIRLPLALTNWLARNRPFTKIAGH